MPELVVGVMTCGCDFGNPKRQECPDDPIWLHRRGCAFWTAEQDWAVTFDRTKRKQPSNLQG